ncbi:MAG: vWA domain-containing protein [Akkermansiaceae bacterium]
MSIHAQLNEEAQAQLARQKRNSTIASGVISILFLAIVGLALGFFLLPNIIKESPTIVTYNAKVTEEDTPEVKKVNTAVQRKPSAPAPTSARVITTTSASATSIPVPDVPVATESVDFGDGEDFGTGWGDGLGFGGGGGATFFNQSVAASRIAYVIDYSGSMNGGKDDLMRKELTKSIGGLKGGTQFQMIFFAGPAWIAGDKAVAKGSEGSVKASKGGKTYKWTGKGAHNWKPVGKRQKAEWLSMTGNQMAKSLKVIKESKLIWGTDWTNPLEMAFEMEPSPQIIFFMTDGSTGGDMMKLTDSLASKAKRKGIIVNCVALMEPKAEEPMLNLAKKTGGAFTIVEKGGKIREVKKVKK